VRAREGKRNPRGTRDDDDDDDDDESFIRKQRE